MVAPIVIEFMLACHCTAYPADEIGERQWNSSAGEQTKLWLIENELVDRAYKATEKGRAWVSFICATPLPVIEWRLEPRDAVNAPSWENLTDSQKHELQGAIDRRWQLTKETWKDIRSIMERGHP